MSSYTIPEEILGVPLFVPDQYDYFSVEAGGMPNGDDCLIVHGDVSNTYKAFIFAPTFVGHDVLHSSLAVGAMTVWFKAANTSAFGFPPQDIMISPATRSGSFPWALCAGNGGSAITMNEDNNGREVAISGVRDGTWHMFTWQFGLGSGGRGFIDNNASGSDGDAFVGATAASTYLCIGAYVSGYTGYDAEWRIGKLAFHDHNLNLTERSILYNAMTV